MTEKLIDDYFKVFILCIETEYQRNYDKRLLGAEEKLLNFIKGKDNVGLIDFIKPRTLDDLTLEDIIQIFLAILLTPTNFGKNLIEDIIKMPERVKKTQEDACNIYRDVLKKATINFCKDNNISISLNFKG